MSGKLEEVMSNIKPVSKEWREKARKHTDKIAIPQGSLGDLMDLAEQLAAIQETLKPSVKKKIIVTMAGDHGVVEEGVSLCPQEVTPQMIHNFVTGGAAVTVLAEVAGAGVTVVDMGVAADLSPLVREGKILSYKIAPGTKNIAKEAAMTREQAVKALEIGIEIAGKLVEEGVEILATGDMGIGNTTPSSAVLAALTGVPAAQVTGRGTGLNDEAVKHKVQVIEKALAVNQPDPKDPIDVLAKVGGFEIGGIAGVILGAAYHRVPILVDGFISTAGAVLAHALAPNSIDYMIAAHQSMEYGHRFMLEELGLTPILNMNMRLGEGSGAALAMNIVESAAQAISKMLTFQDAGVASPKM